VESTSTVAMSQAERPDASGSSAMVECSGTSPLAL
jgi:hypothetical protein